MNGTIKPTLTLLTALLLAPLAALHAGETLPIYQPKVQHAPIYFYHPGAKPALQYNHDVDIVKFKGKFFATWNANEGRGEDTPGQYNFLSVSDDFENWSPPVRLFTRDAGAENPIESDNQWQPIFINWRDETLFCAWCDYSARKTYVATSSDHGRTWTKARPVEIETTISRNYGFSGVGTRDSLLMAMNDNHTRVPERMPQDRYFLSLFVAPVCDPDLHLPGPVIQPEAGRAYYPNGFVDGGKLYVACTST
jgi:hypothetical protein